MCAISARRGFCLVPRKIWLGIVFAVKYAKFQPRNIFFENFAKFGPETNFFSFFGKFGSEMYLRNFDQMSKENRKAPK